MASKNGQRGLACPPSRTLVPAVANWLVWGFSTIMVLSQFAGIVWNSVRFTEDLKYGRGPFVAPASIDGSNDEPYSDRNIVCMSQGRSYIPMQLSHVLGDSKLSAITDTTGGSIDGYRVCKRETVTLDASTIAHFSSICDRIDYTLEAIQDSCMNMGYNITRDTLRIVEDVHSNITKAIPRALPILIMPFWDNAIHAHYAIPGVDGMACVFLLNGMYVDLEESLGVLRGAPRTTRETKTAEWLGRPDGVWRNGWYEDGSGQRWSSDMMSTNAQNPYGIQARQFDTVANVELNCSGEDPPRACSDFPMSDEWGDESVSIEVTEWFNQLFISNGSHFGLFLYEGKSIRTVYDQYSLATLISNMSVVVLLFRWMVSMLAMANSYRTGVAPWQTTGIGCFSNSRTFNLLPIVLLPRMKITLAAFWTIGCEFEGQQRAFADAWFAVYPAIVEILLFSFSVLDLVAKMAHRRVSDALFGPSILALALLHHHRKSLANSPWLGLDGRVSTMVTSDEFHDLGIIDLLRPSVVLRMNGGVLAVVLIKLLLLLLNLAPLLVSEKMTATGKKATAYAICDIETALAVRAARVGGLGLSNVYLIESARLVASKSTKHLLHRPSAAIIPSPPSLSDRNVKRSAIDSFAVPKGTASFGGDVGAGQRRHVLIAYELNRLGYVVYGDKYLISFDDWYILTSLAPLRALERLWNHRVTVFDILKREDGYYISRKPRLCRLDDSELGRIPFYKVTLRAFR